MYRVYDGFIVDENATKNETLDAIMREYDPVKNTGMILRCMEEAFSCGFKSGERYGVGIGRLNERDNPTYKDED